MPKYLAIDYLAQIVQQRRALLGQLLLTVPHHMDYMDTYVHTGTLPDTSYRQPWSRAKMHTLPRDAEEEISELLAYLPKEMLCEWEQYTRSGETDVGMFEIVPSSNPDSQESLQDEILAQLVNEAEKEAEFQEEFCTENLQNVGGEDIKKMLEETASMHHLSLFHNLPPLRGLLNRLQPKSVTDPFLTKDGEAIQEKHVFGGDVTCFDKTMDYLPSDITEEVFEKVLHTDKYLIDEHISLVDITSPPADRPVSTTPELLITQLNLKREEVDVVLKEQQHLNADMNKLLGDNNAVSQPPVEFPEKLVLLRKPSDISLDNVFDFTTLNSDGIGTGFENESWKMSLLESPKTICAESLSANHEAFIKMLQPVAVDLSEKNKGLISPDTKEKMTEQLWECEKFKEDVLCLRIQEPLTKKGPQSYETNPRFAMNIFGLKAEHYIGELELDLQWDPIEYSAMQMAQIMLAERQIAEVDKDDTPGDDWASIEQCERVNLIDCDQHDQEISMESETQALTKVPSAGSQTNYLCDHGKHPAHSSTNQPNHGKHPAHSSANQPSEPSATMNLTCSNLYQRRLEKGRNQLKHLDDVSVLNGADNPKDENFNMLTVKKFEKLPDISKQSFPSDPVEAFMMLRSEKINNRLQPDEVSGSELAFTPEKRKPNQVSASQTHSGSVFSPLTPARSDKRKIKSKIVDVRLTEPFQKILLALKESAQPMLSLLRKKGLIPPNHDFESFTPDVTNFILKQHQKSQDKDDTVAAMKDVYRCVVGLHCLVSTADIVIHCCLQSAIVRLSTLQERYQTTLTGMLEKIRQYLYKQHFVHQQKKVIHPKVAALYSNLHDWISKKKSKSPQGDHKILIIIGRELPSLQAYIKDIGALSSKKVPAILSHTSIATCQEVMASLEDSDSLIMRSSQIQEDFPWAQFSMVVQFEFQEPSDILGLCDRQNIRFIGVKMMPITDIHVTNEELTDMMSQAIGTENSKESTQFLLIGSEKLTGVTHLLQLLEARHNVAIIERPYSKLQKQQQLKHHADIILDERSGILLHDYEEIQHSDWPQYFQDRLVAISLQFQKCWLVFHPKHNSADQYCFGGNAVPNLAKLHMFTSHLCTGDDFTLKILYANTLAETALLIKTVVNKVMEDSNVWSKENWLSRDWINYEMSQQEKTLLSIPCLNSFSAQLLLKLNSVASLAQMSLEELTAQYAWLPRRILHMFHQVMSRDLCQNWQISRASEVTHTQQIKSMYTCSAEDDSNQTLSMRCLVANVAEENGMPGGLSMPSDLMNATMAEGLFGTCNDSESLEPSQECTNEFDKAAIENSYSFQAKGDRMSQNNCKTSDHCMDQEVPTEVGRDGKIRQRKKEGIPSGQQYHSIVQNSEKKGDLTSSWMNSPHDFTKQVGSSGTCYRQPDETGTAPSNTFLVEKNIASRQQSFEHRRPGFEMAARDGSKAQSQKQKLSLIERVGVPQEFQQFIWRAKGIEMPDYRCYEERQNLKLWTEFGDKSIGRQTRPIKHYSEPDPVPSAVYSSSSRSTDTLAGIHCQNEQNRPLMNLPSISAPRCQVSQTETMWRPPSIATVTPRIRRSMETHSDDQQGSSNPASHSSYYSTITRPPTGFPDCHSTIMPPDSPPMDLDEFYREAQIPHATSDQWESNHQQYKMSATNIHPHWRLPASHNAEHEEDPYAPVYDLIKKPKLTYKKVPGAAGGQTKLSFH